MNIERPTSNIEYGIVSILKNIEQQAAQTPGLCDRIGPSKSDSAVRVAGFDLLFLK